MKKGQMIIVSSVVILLFLALLAFQINVDVPPRKSLTNVFNEYENALGASFSSDIDGAISKMDRFTIFMTKHIEGNMKAIYSIAMYDNGILYISISNHYGEEIRNVRIYQDATEEFAVFESIDNTRSETSSFSTVSSKPVQITITYEDSDGEKTIKYQTITGDKKPKTAQATVWLEQESQLIRSLKVTNY